MKLEKLHLYFFMAFLSALFLLKPSVSNGEEIIAAVEHYPPWIIIEPTSISGINIEILNEVAKRLNLQLTLKECPWKRCLHMMEYGEADIMSSLLKRAERKVYMVYIEPPYKTRSTKAFYLPKGKGHLIQKYEDLYHLKVGVTRGVKYFPPFDNDPKINKIEAVADINLLRMLAANRLSAIVSTESQADYLILYEGFQGKFEKAPFKYDKSVPVHLAISKKSRYVKQLPNFNKIMKQMVSEGKIDMTIKNFYDKLKK
jgi:polar amino acid transport system substrate-binding protein